MHDKYAEAIQENGIKSITQTYILIGVAVIMLLVVFFAASYWFYRKNNVQSGRTRRLEIVVVTSATMGYYKGNRNKYFRV